MVRDTWHVKCYSYHARTSSLLNACMQVHREGGGAGASAPGPGGTKGAPEGPRQKN